MRKHKTPKKYFYWFQESKDALRQDFTREEELMQVVTGIGSAMTTIHIKSRPLMVNGHFLTTI